MIKPIKEDGIDAAADLAWSTQETPETASFPRFRSRNALKEKFQDMLKKPEGRLLGCYDGSELKGVLCLFVDSDSRYCEAICGICAAGGDPAVYDEMSRHVAAAFAGYEAILAYPGENKAAADAAVAAGAAPFESSVSMRLAKADFKQGQSGGVNKLGRERFSEYSAFHDAAYPDYYWNAARIREARDKWDVNVYMDGGKICGSVFTSTWDKTEAEIFGVAVDAGHRGRGIEARLITRACSEAFRGGKKSVLFFIDSSDPALRQAAEKCGFKPVSTYKSFRFAPESAAAEE